MPLCGGTGFRPQRAATNFSGDPATPPSRLEKPRTGRDGRRLRGHRSSGGLSIYLWGGLAAVRWFVEWM